VLMVTGFRAVASAAPRGECELHRTLIVGANLRDTGINDGDVGFVDRHICNVVRTVFDMARDIVKMLPVW
jgi:hypothetical protein